MFLIVALLALLTLASSASAYVPTYYNQAAYTTDFRAYTKAINGSYPGVAADLAMNLGGSAAGSTRAAATRRGVWLARLGARTLPALRVVGPIGVTLTGFEVGWKIGRFIDTKWLHLSGEAGDVGFSSTAGRIRDVDPAEWKWVASQARWEFAVFSDWGHPCGLEMVFVHVTPTAYRNDLYGTDRTVCSAFGRDAFNYIASLSGVGATIDVPCGGLASMWTPAPSACFKMILSESEMMSRVQLKTFRDYQVGDEYFPGLTTTRTTNNYDPSWSAQGFPSQTAQDEAAREALNSSASNAPGMHVDHSLNPSGSVPDPLVDFAWLAAEPDETYSQYVARLQSAGWLGTATVVTLAENNGDSEYIAGGVPCTSVATGALIAPSEAVTMYKNAATFGSGDPTSGPACPGRLATTQFGKKCAVPGYPPWDLLIIGNETFYNDACDEAWEFFWEHQTAFTEDGEIFPSAIANELVVEMVDGPDIGDADVKIQLQAQDSNMANWVKGRTEMFEGPHWFEVHFYWHLPTSTIRFDLDYKIKFDEAFTP